MKDFGAKKNSLKLPVLVSGIFHVVFFSFFIASPTINVHFFKDKTPKIDMIFVELPKGSSDDIGEGLKKSEGLPKSTIEEQKKIFQPEPTPTQKTLPPTMSAPPLKLPEEKQKEVLKKEKRPEIDTTKMKIVDPNKKPELKPQPVASKTDKRIRDALASIDKDLSKQVVPESAQIDRNNDGYKYGTSDKPLRISRSDPEFLKYQAMVRAKIKREWIRPTAELPSSIRAEFIVSINDDGDVTSVRPSRSSGNASFDQSAIRAVKKASPFPKPPDRIAWEAYNEGFTVGFNPGM